MRTSLTPFDRLMRDLIAVPKAELDAEEAKYQAERKKAKAAKKATATRKKK